MIIALAMVPVALLLCSAWYVAESLYDHWLIFAHR